MDNGPAGDVRLMLGDCLDRMAEIGSATVDAIICDPPYPEIDRPYGRMTEADWHAMMRGVVAESRRVLKPSGSAVFILQSNSERIGRMRPWLWEFMAWTAREWNMVQDAYWLNHRAMPEAHSIQGRLMRPALKSCVWLGSPACYRDQDEVLWEEAESVTLRKMADRANAKRYVRINSPGGHGVNHARAFASAERRGGVSPLNVLVAGHGRSQDTAGGNGHPAGTPDAVADWWVRYISPEGGTVCDPFMGSGTVGLAALKRGRRFIGIERDPTYFATASSRIAACRASTPLFAEATP